MSKSFSMQVRPQRGLKGCQRRLSPPPKKKNVTGFKITIDGSINILVLIFLLCLHHLICAVILYIINFRITSNFIIVSIPSMAISCKISESTKNIYQLGAGRTGPGDSDKNLPRQLHLSKSKLM